MPTEHEFKYVMKMNANDIQTPKEIRDIEKRVWIQQGYLAFSKGMTTRVRSVQKISTEFALGTDPKKKWYLTFKQKSLEGRVIEIEKKIDERDGTDLWDIAIGKLKKIRTSFDNNDITWEVDCFFSGQECYFIMVEAEMPEGSPRPELPTFMQPFLLHAVDLDDERFGNKRLGDVEYATKIYNELTKEHNNEKHRKNLQPN